ncbi:MAG: thrombospondin type 3 repeat-containing protein [Akkermansiaceae bacterium]
MKLPVSIALCSACLLSAQTLLLEDNFDAPDNANLDLSDQTGRRSGTVPTIQVRSSRIQHGIIGNQLNFRNNRTGRIRFHDDSDNDNTTAGVWYDWAGPTTGPVITSGGGLRIEFDWIAGNDSSTNWVSVNMGISGPGVPEPGFRVNNAETDIGMLFRFNGQTELFDNGTNLGSQGTFTPTIGPRQVVVDYLFNAFADGTVVDMIASVDGVEVYNGSGFTFDNNLGALYFEIGNLEDTILDNLAISALGDSGYRISLGNDSFISASLQGAAVGTLSATNEGTSDPSTFTLVAGEGDTDNDKFQINGDQLEIGNFDFTGANSIDGQEFSIRVRGSGTGTTEQAFTLTLTKDDDGDNLPDDWELRWANDLTVLSGSSGTENADSDTLTDLQEFELSQGTSSLVVGTYPDIDPTSGDGDSDGLDDDEEILPSPPRLVTDPGNPDTDDDGLDDFIESNSGTFVDGSDTGSSPLNCDTDGDGARDGHEVSNNSDPLNGLEIPAPASTQVTVQQITTDLDSEISLDKTYTHAISGGEAGTVNGVFFEALEPTITPVNFNWDTFGNIKSEINANSAQWAPDTAAIPQLFTLLNSFTYSGNGAGPGSRQQFTLSNLTPGQNYDLRFYLRPWTLTDSGRPIDLIFTNGDQVIQPYFAFPEDRLGSVLGIPDQQQTILLNFNYTAEGTDLVIDANVPDCAVNPSGSFHMYALTNEVSTSVESPLMITNTAITTSGQFVIAFRGKPETSYQVTKSSTLDGAFSPLDLPLFATTDSNGDGQAIVPSSEASDSKEFYRLEE